MLEYLKFSPDIWDIIIIGGGASGLGCAVDAASRGFRTLLLEQSDFAKATSSRSTKLIHGGLRYLKQGHISLVKECLKEREILIKNAPHLIQPLGFVIPNYHWWEGAFYGIGLQVYDRLVKEMAMEGSHLLNREATLNKMPNLEPNQLKGSNLYFDAQFDDARLAITLAQTAESLGGVVINYVSVTKFLKQNEKICGVEAVDLMTKESYRLHSKVVINATGVFSDIVRKMDDNKARPVLEASQGAHIVLPKSFLDGECALLIPRTEDKRVLYALPWHEHVLVGTTDIANQKPTLEPKPYEEEIDFLVRSLSKYLQRAPKKEDILSTFAGLRPLVNRGRRPSSSLSRDHALIVSPSNLISICGGKWTTYRKMAEDTINKAIKIGNLKEYPCTTSTLRLYGYLDSPISIDSWTNYGKNSKKLYEMVQHRPELGVPFHHDLPYMPVEVHWAVKEEMAVTLEDVLARRLRALFLNARASIAIAPEVASIMATLLHKDKAWIEGQVADYAKLARNYLVSA